MGGAKTPPIPTHIKPMLRPPLPPMQQIPWLPGGGKRPIIAVENNPPQSFP